MVSETANDANVTQLDTNIDYTNTNTSGMTCSTNYNIIVVSGQSKPLSNPLNISKTTQTTPTVLTPPKIHSKMPNTNINITYSSIDCVFQTNPTNYVIIGQSNTLPNIAKSQTGRPHTKIHHSRNDNLNTLINCI